MKGFSVRNGDVVVDKTIEMVDGSELLRQKCELVIGTNQGEWSYDPEEGIDFRVVLRKNYDADEIRAEIEAALQRIDDTFTVTEFAITEKGRIATVTFKAVNGDGVEVEGGQSYGS